MNRRLIVIGAIVLAFLTTTTGGDAAPHAAAASENPLPLAQANANPPQRQDASMAFDDATQTIVLFGGTDCSASCVTFGDTWTWNGSSWTVQHPATSPPPRLGASMAYDPVSRTVLLFGGQVCDATGCYSANDTWAWNGRTWTALVPPPQRPTTTPTVPPASPTLTPATTRTPTPFVPSPTAVRTPTSPASTPTPAAPH